MEVPPNGWFIREHPIKMDDLGDTPVSGNLDFEVSLEKSDPQTISFPVDKTRN